MNTNTKCWNSFSKRDRKDHFGNKIVGIFCFLSTLLQLIWFYVLKDRHVLQYMSSCVIMHDGVVTKMYYALKFIIKKKSSFAMYMIFVSFRKVNVLFHLLLHSFQTFEYSLCTKLNKPHNLVLYIFYNFVL